MILPIVDINVVVKASSENLNKTQVFPTPESPIKSNLNKRSYVFFAILQSQLNNNDVIDAPVVQCGGDHVILTNVILCNINI